MNSTGKSLLAATVIAAAAGGAAFLYSPDISDNDLPEVEIPKVEVPVVEIPQVMIPAASVQISMPEVQPIIGSGDISAVQIGMTAGSAAAVAGGVVELHNVATPQIHDPAGRLPMLQQFARRVARQFRDKRNAALLSADKRASAKWLTIAEKEVAYTPDYIPLPSGLRMAAEIHHPISSGILAGNLARYRKAGCNSVLITFGYPGESLPVLLATAAQCRRAGLNPWFAYAGPESIQHSIFRDPDELASAAAQLAQACDGVILGWRRTSVHMYRQDDVFQILLLRAAREANPKLAILGEIYYGETERSARDLALNLPTGVSGALVTGFGFQGVAVESVVAALHKKVGSTPLVPLIVGRKPYYATRNRDGRSAAVHWREKMAVAFRWLSAGVSGVVILHGDGSDGIYDPKQTDNLAQTE